MFNTSKKFNFLKILGKYFGTVTAAVRDFVRKGVEAGTKADVPKLVVESTIQGVSWNVIVASSAAAWTAAKYVSDNAGPYYNANIKGKLGPLVRHLYNNMTPPNMGSNPSPVAVHRLIRQLEQERFTAFESAIRRHHAMLNKLSHEPIIRQPLMADLDPVDQAVAAEIVYNALVDDIIRGVVVEALLVAPDVLNVIVP